MVKRLTSTISSTTLFLAYFCNKYASKTSAPHYSVKQVGMEQDILAVTNVEHTRSKFQKKNVRNY